MHLHKSGASDVAFQCIGTNGDSLRCYYLITTFFVIPSLNLMMFIPWPSLFSFLPSVVMILPRTATHKGYASASDWRKSCIYPWSTWSCIHTDHWCLCKGWHKAKERGTGEGLPTSCPSGKLYGKTLGKGQRPTRVAQESSEMKILCNA